MIRFAEVIAQSVRRMFRSVRGGRAPALSACLIAAAVAFAARPARADWFEARLDAVERGNSIVVVVRVSAMVGENALNDHPLGTYSLTGHSTVQATLNAGEATFRMDISATADMVRVVIDMDAPGSPTQVRVVRTDIRR